MKRQNFKSLAAHSLLVTLSTLLLTGAAAIVDPTRPPDSLLPESKTLNISGPLKLSAVFIYPHRRYAIISNQIATIEDKVGEYSIINIQRDTVELKSSKDDSVTLTLLPTVKKVRVTNEG
tara:strand:+ start:3362 stop:3721 length:360 start_codon:yes stop_codon:yes gene_type:complete